MLKSRKLALDIQQEIKLIFEFAKTKTESNSIRAYQLPIYLKSLEEFNKYNFLERRGIDMYFVKMKIDEDLGTFVYKDQAEVRDLYKIDSDNPAFEDIEMWKIKLHIMLANIKKLITPFLNEEPFYVSYW